MIVKVLLSVLSLLSVFFNFLSNWRDFSRCLLLLLVFEIKLWPRLFERKNSFIFLFNVLGFFYDRGECSRRLSLSQCFFNLTGCTAFAFSNHALSRFRSRCTASL